MTSNKAKKLRKEKPNEVAIPFRVVPQRDSEIIGMIPIPIVPRHPAKFVTSKAAPKSLKSEDRPTLPGPKRALWWETTIAISLLIHALAVLAFSLKYTYDLERAAGAASSTSAEGTLAVPIEIVVTAILLSAPTPTDAASVDTKVAAQITPKEEQKAEEKFDAEPPQKSDEAPETVLTAKSGTSPENRERKKKEETHLSRSAATNPGPAASSHTKGHAGAGGLLESGGTADISSYQALVLAHLQRFRSYPATAKSGGIKGMATVRFSLASNGSVTSVSLARGSGTAILDEAALSMIHRASPFPPFPPGLGRSRIDFAAPVRFDFR
jgi:TonB family protein